MSAKSSDTRLRLPPILELARARLRQGTKTARWPKAPITLPERFRGRPVLSPERCPDGCRDCLDACPVGAIALQPLRIDLGACLFCPACAEACSHGALRFGGDHRLATTAREDLWVERDEVKLAHALGAAGSLFTWRVHSSPAGATATSTRSRTLWVVPVPMT